MGLVGIEQLKELLAFGVSLGNGLGKSLEDGAISLPDVSNFFDALLKAPAAFGGIGEVPAELADLDAEELAALKQFVVDEFDIPQDKTEQVVEAGLDLAIQVFAFIALLKSTPDEPVV